MGVSERQKKPSVTRSFNRLLLASVLSLQRSRGSGPVVPATHFKCLIWNSVNPARCWFRSQQLTVAGPERQALSRRSTVHRPIYTLFGTA
jgi:hypothetical protein